MKGLRTMVPKSPFSALYSEDTNSFNIFDTVNLIDNRILNALTTSSRNYSIGVGIGFLSLYILLTMAGCRVQKKAVKKAENLVKRTKKE